MTRLVFAAMFGLTGCVVDHAIRAVDSVPNAIGEASRTHGVSPWEGHYLFSECRPDAPRICWAYEVVVDSSGKATIRADGANLAIHVTSKPEAEDEVLRLPFESYLDGNPDDEFIHPPFAKRKGFGAGELLATIGYDRGGRRCLVFAALRSPLGSRAVCAQ